MCASPEDRSLKGITCSPTASSAPTGTSPTSLLAMISKARRNFSFKQLSDSSAPTSPLDKALSSIWATPGQMESVTQRRRNTTFSHGQAQRSSSLGQSLSPCSSLTSPRSSLISSSSSPALTLLDQTSPRSSRMMSRQTSSALWTPDTVVTLLSTEVHLQDLVDLLAVSPPNTTIDLNGNTLGGALCGAGGGCAVLELCVESTFLRNGTLELPDGASLVVSARNVRFQGLTILGTGAYGSSVPVVRRGLVEVDGGGWVRMKGCALGAASATKCSSLLVRGGGCAKLTDCELRGAFHGSALLAQGLGTHVVLTTCFLHDGQDSCVLALMGALVELDRCQVQGSGERSAAEAVGSGTCIVAHQSRLLDSAHAALMVHAGARAELEGCELSGARERDVVEIRGAGSRVSARNCKIHDGAEHGIYCGAGAVASLSQCWVYGNALSAVTADDPGTHVTVTACILDGDIDPCHGAAIIVNP